MAPSRDHAEWEGDTRKVTGWVMGRAQARLAIGQTGDSLLPGDPRVDFQTHNPVRMPPSAGTAESIVTSGWRLRSLGALASSGPDTGSQVIQGRVVWSCGSPWKNSPWFGPPPPVPEHPAESPWDGVGAGRWRAGTHYQNTLPAHHPKRAAQAVPSSPPGADNRIFN